MQPPDQVLVVGQTVMQAAAPVGLAESSMQQGFAGLLITPQTTAAAVQGVHKS